MAGLRRKLSNLYKRGGEYKMINRKIAMSLFSITAALILVGGSAFAFFTDTASNNGNTFGTGSLTLSINSQTPTSTGVFSVTNVAPGDVKEGLLNLKNEGSVNASDVVLTGVDLNSGSDLAPVLILRLVLDNDSSGTVNGGDTVLAGPATMDDSSWINKSLGLALPANVSKPVIAEITFDSNAGDTYQGKSLNFDLNFQANQ